MVPHCRHTSAPGLRCSLQCQSKLHTQALTRSGARPLQTFRETQPGETGVPAYSVNVSLLACLLACLLAYML